MRSNSWFFWLAIFAISTLVACTASQRETEQTHTTPAVVVEDQLDQPLPKVLIIGDSISMAYTKPVVRLMQGKADVSRIPGNGRWAGYGVEKIDEWLGDEQWDVIHFNWGLWDMYGWEYRNEDISHKAYEKRLEKLVTRLKETDAKLIWATTTPVCTAPEVSLRDRFDTVLVISPEVEKRYLDAAERVMKRHDIQINDLHALVLPEMDKLSPAPDNVHFNAAGTNKLAQQVAEVITVAIDVKANP